MRRTSTSRSTYFNSGMGKRSLAAINQSTTRYMPTYRLEPKNPFNRDVCHRIIKNAMDIALEELKDFNPNTIPSLCASISEEINQKVKSFHYDRYKFVCVVTIGEKFMQDFDAVAMFFWDSKQDDFVSYTYDTTKFFAIGTLYVVYHQ